MKVSIITVSYNSAETIEDTFRSVLSQDYPDLEYIVVDGGSRDGTLPIIERYRKNIGVFVSEPDRGIYDAMDKGLRRATGDVVGILNSDDVYAHPGVIRSVVETFARSQAGGVYGDLIYVSPDLQKVVRYWRAGSYEDGMFLKGWMPPHPAFFVRRQAYERFGYFDQRLKSAADYELMLRFVHKEKLQISYLPQVLVKMRTGGQSNQSLLNRLRANREDRLAWRLNGLRPSPLTLWLKPLRKINQFIAADRYASRAEFVPPR